MSREFNCLLAQTAVVGNKERCLLEVTTAFFAKGFFIPLHSKTRNKPLDPDRKRSITLDGNRLAELALIKIPWNAHHRHPERHALCREGSSIRAIRLAIVAPKKSDTKFPVMREQSNGSSTLSPDLPKPLKIYQSQEDYGQELMY